MTQKTRMLTPREVATRLDVSPETVREWIRAGTIAATQYPSGRYRVPETAVEEIEQPASPAPAPKATPKKTTAGRSTGRRSRTQKPPAQEGNQ